MIAYTVDGVPLTDPTGRWDVLDTSVVAPAMSINASDVQIPGVAGSLPFPSQPQSSAQMTFDMKIQGTDQDSMWHYYTALAGLFTRGSTLGRTIGSSVTSADMELQSISQPVFVQYLNLFTATAVVKLPNVFWRAPAGDWSQAAPVSGTAYEVMTLAGSTAPITDALILVTGPATSPTVACGAEWLKVGAVIAAGSAALVDCGAWTVRIGTGVTFDGGGTLTSGVLTNSGASCPLPLVPVMRATDPVDTEVSVTLTATGLTSASAIGVRARSAQLV